MAPPRPRRPSRFPLYAAVVLIAVGLATYANGLSSPFIWDDEPAIVSNETIRNVLPLSDSMVPPLETAVAGRPIVNLSLAVNYAAGGLGETGYHVWNLAVLIASGLLLFAIVRLTLLRQKQQAMADVVASVSALVWIAHPLLSETVEYSTQRTESMMGLFFLLTLYAAIRGRESRGWTIASAVACAAGMATKESMAVAPLAVVLYDRVFEFDSMADAVKARRGLYAALAATWIELALLMWRWPRSTVGATAHVSPWTYLLNQAQMIVRYLGLAVWPQSLVIDYGIPRPLSLGDVLPQALLLTALLALALVALVRWPAFGFLGAMFFLTLAPTSSLVPVASEVGAERRMFLPLASLSILAAALGWIAVERLKRRWPERSNAIAIAAIGATTVIVSALAVRTALRNREYVTPIQLWETVVERRPQGRARFALATEYITAGRHQDAIDQLRLAVTDYPDARAGLGTELLALGHTAEAVSVLDNFIQANPSSPNRIPARILLGNGQLLLDRPFDAERQFKLVLDADPANGPARQGMANVVRLRAAALLKQGNVVQAATVAREALQFNPGDADAHNVLGVALASQGQLADAIGEFQTTLRISPNHQSASANLARALAITGQKPAAR
jgi:tetratricopeptide (TPR) repeat protein